MTAILTIIGIACFAVLVILAANAPEMPEDYEPKIRIDENNKNQSRNND